ncbi:MAG: hypothetical protein AABZ60_10855 [Planctomycetota bacterium]
MNVYGPGNIVQLRDPTLSSIKSDKIYQIPSRTTTDLDMKKGVRETGKLSKGRANRIARIRQQIERGEYEIEQKLSLALDHLLEDLQKK